MGRQKAPYFYNEPLEAWLNRQKLNDGTNTGAPLLVDRLVGAGVSAPKNILDPRIAWYTTAGGTKVALASHRLSGGLPAGGNFLFADGRVVWFKNKTIQPAITFDDPWVWFFRVPIF